MENVEATNNAIVDYHVLIQFGTKPSADVSKRTKAKKDTLSGFYDTKNPE